MSRPRLLDLFCGAGGAAVGYHRAGFDVVGVDLHPQPRYPFPFVQADALAFLDGNTIVGNFDVVHASPPCQRWTNGAAKWGTSDDHPDLVGPVRTRLVEAGLPFVIENVLAAPLIRPVVLCGDWLGLGVFRHRGFECNINGVTIAQPPHPKHSGRIGDGRFCTVAGHAGGSSRRDGWTNGGTDAWRKAMGIDWMNGRELAEAIPPTYTEYIGRCIIGYL